jgi:predicted AlkP superfamily pyrophosphatase or phosphodiesterase
MRIHVLVDGLGWEIAKDLPAFDFLKGERNGLETVLGFSSTAIPTILTGRMPEEHGIWNLFRYDPNHSDFPLFKRLGRYAGFVDRSRILRKTLLEANRLSTGFEGYYQAYEIPSALLGSLSISERKNLYQPGGTGNCPSVFDRWKETGRNWISASWRDGGKTDAQVLAIARAKFVRQLPESVFIYLAGFDAFGHRNATDESAMKSEATRIAGMLLDFLNFCRRYNACAQMDVFSDHGMVPLEGTIDLPSLLVPVRKRLGNTPWIEVFDATMARFWWKDVRSEYMVRDAIEGRNGHFLSDEELETHRVRFNWQYGDSIWLADPGFQIVPSHMAKVPLGGMHGYDPKTPHMRASFLSTRDRIQPPQAIWELLPTMLEPHFIG